MVLIVEVTKFGKYNILHWERTMERAKRFVNESGLTGNIRFFEESDVDPFTNCMTCKHRIHIDGYPEKKIACWDIADYEGSDHRAVFEDGSCHVCNLYEKE